MRVWSTESRQRVLVPCDSSASQQAKWLPVQLFSRIRCGLNPPFSRSAAEHQKSIFTASSNLIWHALARGLLVISTHLDSCMFSIANAEFATARGCNSETTTRVRNKRSINTAAATKDRVNKKRPF